MAVAVAQLGAGGDVFEGANYFATLDLLQGFWQMPMDAEGEEAFAMGRRGTAATLQVLCPYCVWNSMETDAGSFFKQCLH